MKKMLLLVGLLAMFSATAQVAVKGYTKANGTYVAPHQRTAPDNTLNNNYSTKGNVNPYTGKAGTVDPTSAPSSSWSTPAPAPATQSAKPACNSTYQTC